MSNHRAAQKKAKQTDRLEFVFERSRNLIQVTRHVPDLLDPVDKIISTLQDAKHEFPQAVEISLDVDWRRDPLEYGFELIVLRPKSPDESSRRIETQRAERVRLKKLADKEARDAINIARIQALEKELRRLKKEPRSKKG